MENPAYILPLVLELRHPQDDMDDATRRQLIERLALSLPDPSRVRLLIDPEGTGRYDNFYPVSQVAATPSTTDAIDTFLSTYGRIDEAEEELLNRMIFNPVPDYAATLERETPAVGAPRDEQDRLLDAFIASDHTLPADNIASEHTLPADKEEEKPAEPKPKVAEPARPVQHAPNGSLLSQSLAKIFIKQHNYKRAYEIISSLSLNYPEKSIYFADQMRFLRKLIANQEAQERACKSSLTNKC